MATFLELAATLWNGRRAHPRSEALEAVSGLAPAVVITGSSRGIGFAIASNFASRGYNVVITGRTASKVEAAAAALQKSYPMVNVVPLALDMTSPDTPGHLIEACRRAGLYPDILVNNAGIGLSGPFVAQNPGEIDVLLETNVRALTRLTRALLPDMLDRARGGIINVASLGGYVPGPYQAVYYSSKAYVIAMTEAIGAELSGSGVRISALVPGPVATSFHVNMNAEKSYYRRLIPEMTPEAVARACTRGFLMGRRVIIPGLINLLAAVILRLLPHAVTIPLVAFLLRPRQASNDA